jgi:hypothetical protein
VEQYVTAAGGEAALSAAKSMYTMGKVRMRTTSGGEDSHPRTIICECDYYIRHCK